MRGQGEALLSDIRRELRGASADDLDGDESMLATLVAAREEEGLRFLALVRPDGHVDASAGAPLAPLSELVEMDREPRRAPAITLLSGGVRMMTPMGRHRGGHRDPGPPPDSFPPPPHSFLPGRGALIVMDFVPLEALALEREAHRALVASVVGAAGLVSAALVLAVLVVRQRKLEKTHEERQQLARLGEMSAVLAHEIRNPLASLKGHAQLLVEQLEPGSRTHRKATRVVDEAQRLEALTSSLLDFARGPQIFAESVDPSYVLRRAAETVSADRISVRSVNAPDAWTLDPMRMEQVLVNLLKNALQSAPDGVVETSVSLENDELRFSVRDHGEGISPSLSLFEPFQTTRVRGTGLGLVISRRIVELHAGRIEASNHPDGGAVFTVILPRRKA